MAVELQINGKTDTVPEGTSIMDMLAKKGIKSGSVVVEVNLGIIDRNAFKDTILQDKDKVEIISFMAGG
jgi:sulfur carrier protein